MNEQVQYRMALLRESMHITGQLLLIRLHLKQVSKEELEHLNQNAENIRIKIQEIQNDKTKLPRNH
jgi:hypothetical protein